MLPNQARYHWQVEYRDGNREAQIESDGTKRFYKDIQHDKLKQFELWEGGTRVVLIKLNPDDKLIWLRRVARTASEIVEACQVVGKKSYIDGEKVNEGVILLFETDGRMEAAGKFNDKLAWLTGPQGSGDHNEHAHWFKDE